MDSPLDQYIRSHISSEPPQLRALYRDTNLTTAYPHMCSGHLQGRILTMLTRMIAPRRILELGTFTGYSALCFAEGMPEDAELYTVEIDDEMEDRLLEEFSHSEAGERIHLVTGDAMEVVPALEVKEWDLVFIDANKRMYPDYYRMVFPLVRPGGYIFADNTLWGGKVAEEGVKLDAQTRGILEFNDMVAADERVETVILPLRDGLTVIRKKNL